MAQSAYFFLGALALACAVYTASYVAAVALVLVGATLIAYGDKGHGRAALAAS